MSGRGTVVTLYKVQTPTALNCTEGTWLEREGAGRDIKWGSRLHIWLLLPLLKGSWRGVSGLTMGQSDEALVDGFRLRRWRGVTPLWCN